MYECEKGKAYVVHKRGLTTLGSDDTALSESVVEKLEVRLLEKALGRSIGVGAVSDDDIKLGLVLLEELEAVADVGLDLGVGVANGHAGEVLLAETNDGLVDVAEDGLLDRLVLDDLTEDTTVTTANDEDLLGVGVGHHGEVGDHLLVGELVALSGLDNVVEDKDHAVVGRLEDEDILVLGLLVVNDLLDLEGHGLTRPHVADLAEPAIYTVVSFTLRALRLYLGRTNDGGVSDAAHFGGFEVWLKSVGSAKGTCQTAIKR